MPLVTVDDIDTLLGGGLSGDRLAQLEILLDLAVGEIESYLGRPIVEDEFVEEVDVDTEGRVFLTNTPVTSVESVSFAGYDIDEDYWIPRIWGVEILGVSRIYDGDIIRGVSLYTGDIVEVVYSSGLPERAIKAINSILIFGVLEKFKEIPTATSLASSGDSDVKSVRVEDYEYTKETKAGAMAKYYASQASPIAIFASERDFMPIKRYKRLRTA